MAAGRRGGEPEDQAILAGEGEQQQAEDHGQKSLAGQEKHGDAGEEKHHSQKIAEQQQDEKANALPSSAVMYLQPEKAIPGKLGHHQRDEEQAEEEGRKRNSRQPP